MRPRRLIVLRQASRIASTGKIVRLSLGVSRLEHRKTVRLTVGICYIDTLRPVKVNPAPWAFVRRDLLTKAGTARSARSISSAHDLWWSKASPSKTSAFGGLHDGYWNFPRGSLRFSRRAAPRVPSCPSAALWPIRAEQRA